VTVLALIISTAARRRSGGFLAIVGSFKLCNPNLCVVYQATKSIQVSFKVPDIKRSLQLFFLR
jgi:hypothetical protein